MDDRSRIKLTKKEVEEYFQMTRKARLKYRGMKKEQELIEQMELEALSRLANDREAALSRLERNNQ